MSSLSVIILAVSLVAVMASAAPSSHPSTVKPRTVAEMARQGEFIGGATQGPQSLLRVQRRELSQAPDSAPSEQLIFDLGDTQGIPLQHKAGYFHASVARDHRRVVIDLSQVEKSAVDGRDLALALRGSRIFDVSELVLDPFDHVLKIVLYTRVPITLSAKVENEPDRQNQIVFDVATEKRGHL